MPTLRWRWDEFDFLEWCCVEGATGASAQLLAYKSMRKYPGKLVNGFNGRCQ